MRRFLILLGLLLVPLQPQGYSATTSKCLPAGIKGTDVVSVLSVKAGVGGEVLCNVW